MPAPDSPTLTRRPAPRAGGPLTDRARLLALLGLALVSIAVFLTVDVAGSWAYALERRSGAVATMVVVGVAIAVSTVLFQTVTNNQILTPSIMGFDSLYLLVQTVAVFFIGAAASTAMNPVARFGIETLLMVGFSLALYRWLLVGLGRSLHLLVLVGVVCGVFFRSIAGLLQRIMDPTQFVVLQDRFFADFSHSDPRLLAASAVVVAIVGAFAWRMLATLDVMALGREAAVNLGIEHRRVMMTVLVMVSVLVSVSTALVGPTTFFGLLVAHVAYQVMGSHRHRVTVVAASLVAVVCLVGGQAVLERLLGFGTSLSIIVDFLGGLVFIALLLRRSTP